MPKVVSYRLRLKGFLISEYLCFRHILQFDIRMVITVEILGQNTEDLALCRHFSITMWPVWMLSSILGLSERGIKIFPP